MRASYGSRVMSRGLWRPLVVRWNHRAASIDASRLEFSKRNHVIEKQLTKYYPSVSTLASDRVLTIEQFYERYAAIAGDEAGTACQVDGRIKNIRFSGKKICFIDLFNTRSGKSLQLIVNASKVDSSLHERFESDLRFLKVGDYIRGSGYPGLSQRQRTVSLKCTELPRVLACAQMPLPPRLSDASKVKQNRVVDYQVNRQAIETLMLRQTIINSIRSWLNERQFVEVETPMLSSQSNGAAAEPFVTKSNSLPKESAQLELRVAPELWLKRLIIGGFDKVYEIGKVFRNEGIDSIHNPEFTTLEFYQTFLSMQQLISLSESLFKKIVLDLHKRHSNETLESLVKELENANWKFRRLEFLPTLSQELGVDVTKLDLSDTEALYNVVPPELNLPRNLSPQQILNKLSSVFIEQRHCSSLLPTVLYHHPTVMSPLAKTSESDPTITKRFEIFVKGKEYINAYEEENCPQMQLAKFEQQSEANKLYKDKESLNVDYRYVEAMKWGMPPIGGFGLGIDRLCMLLLNKARIEDVLAFGCLDDVNRQ
ncbi:hypothetical protein HG537_0B02790 [Torulaspora globosa]|uniref:lysine--tRNA ligase n=1 Tax=Torulaspora globosa TaxID=48254 RepID=A0A7H9HRG6_9SACH|nr:hypothetical protein HG537_0B02790 [Torulaspora sp. CBS 2947]